MNKIDSSKFLPKHFTEEDKIEYELLCDDARRIFKDIKHDFIIQTCVLAHINEKKGLSKQCSDEEIKEVMSRYDLSGNTVYETPFDPDFDFKKTMKDIIEPIQEPVE
jgi:hypothetical protein